MRRKQLGIAILAVLGLVGTSRTPAGRQVCYSAHQFVRHFHALEHSGLRTGFFQRATVSLVLASADAADCARRNAQ